MTWYDAWGIWIITRDGTTDTSLFGVVLDRVNEANVRPDGIVTACAFLERLYEDAKMEDAL